jgi:uncharacterized membrane protein YfcA
LLATIFAIGAVGGLLSGMLGVGGAVILLPLLTTFAGLSLKEASNVTIVQVVASALVGWLAYQRGSLVHLPLAIHMGAASALGGIVGGYGSRAFSSRALEWLFLAVVLAAIALLLIPVREVPADVPAGGGPMPRFNRWYALGLGAAVGVLAGLLGAGGGFLIVPLMIGALRLPPRLAIGSSPVVILVSAGFALAGKVLAGVVEPRAAAALVAGAVPCAYLGALAGGRMPTPVLRLLLAAILVAVAIRGVVSLLT